MGHETVVEQLLQAGANKNAVDERGLTALDWAQFLQNWDLIRLLQAFAAGGSALVIAVSTMLQGA